MNNNPLSNTDASISHNKETSLCQDKNEQAHVEKEPVETKDEAVVVSNATTPQKSLSDEQFQQAFLDGWGFMMQAISTDDTENISLFAEFDSVANYRGNHTVHNKKGGTSVLTEWTALHECVRLNKPEVLSVIVQAAAGKLNLEVLNREQETPLLYATNQSASRPNPHIVAKALLDAGANPNATDYNGRSALFWAMSFGDDQFVRVLLEAGASVDQVDTFGWSAQKALKEYKTVFTKNEAEKKFNRRLEKVMNLLRAVSEGNNKNNNNKPKKKSGKAKSDKLHKFR